MAEFGSEGRRKADLARRVGQNRDAVAQPSFLCPSDGQRGQYGYFADTQDELAASHDLALNR